MVIKLCIIISICLIIFKIYLDNNFIEVLNYKICSKKVPKEFNSFKILQLSDLHSKRFGKENSRLIKKVEEVNPDIVVITGDMVNDDFDCSSFECVINKLIKKYKIYYIIGNHEQNVMIENHTKFNRMIEGIKRAGVNVLSNEKIRVNISTEYINLYGMHMELKYYRNFRKKESRSVYFNIEDMEELIGRRDKETYNVLLSHNPIYFDTYSKWGADIVLTGHIHGGMIKLPFLGGVFSPEHKFFPEYYQGIYKKDNSFMNVNRGLGRGSFGIRLFNKPEISVITLHNS